MRLCPKKKNAILAVILLVGGFIVIRQPNLFQGDSPQVVRNDLSWQTDRLVRKDSWVEQGGYLPLNVSYRMLAGAPSPQQRFLCIGLSSVKRQRVSYLRDTLQSIFSQSSPDELSSMVVVVLLADFDLDWRVATVKEIQTSFPLELEQGQLVVIHVPKEWYPNTTGLKRNYNDEPDRVTFRSKQNIDYSFLMHYSTSLGQYYLQLEDDILSSKNFLTAIKKHITEQDAKDSTWIMLEFSVLGYIGKLYKSEHLPLLARFLFLFYQEMPCDWLMTHFRELLVQRQSIVFRPSLFQHMGQFSSFRGTFNKLKDKFFDEYFYTNPEAQVFSDMPIYQNYLPQKAWDPGEDFFWGRSPEEGNYLTVVFTEPTVITGILVETGQEGKDVLESGEVQIGHTVADTGKDEKSCQEFQSVGSFTEGRFEITGLNNTHSSASSCLRIQVTAKQSNWVVIRKIRITTELSATPALKKK